MSARTPSAWISPAESITQKCPSFVSYVNRFKNTFEIKANAEIAVQEVVPNHVNSERLLRSWVCL